MKRSSASMLACILFMAVQTAAFSSDTISTGLHLHLSGLRMARPPEVVEGYLVLSAMGPYRFVGAAFSHESWQKVHSFERNLYGVFVLAIPLPFAEARTTHYRLVLDGLWAADPINPARIRDPETGTTMSAAELPNRPRTVLGVWDPAGTDHATFFFRGEPGQRVTVAGSFNAWDPFIHELEETTPGNYALSLRLQPGDYHYVFVYQGQRLPDPLNRRLLYSRDGKPVSALTILASQ